MQVTLLMLAAALSATAASLFNSTAALPPLNSIVFITPSGKNTRDQSLRHCSFSASFDPYDGGNDDFAFTLIEALNGAPNAVSFRSVNYPAQYLSLKTDGISAGFRIGIVATPDVSTASWTATSTGKADGGMTLTTLSTTPGLSGRMLTISTNSSGPCNLSPQKPDAVLSPPKQDAASQSFLIGARPSPGPSPSPPPPPPMVPATISVDATSVDHILNPAHNGCHVDVGFGACAAPISLHFPPAKFPPPSHSHPPSPPTPKHQLTTLWLGPQLLFMGRGLSMAPLPFESPPGMTSPLRQVAALPWTAV